MTLTQAIEAAREGLKTLKTASRMLTEQHRVILRGKVWGGSDIDKLEQALAALPEPMTEAKLEGKIGTAIAFYRNDGDSFFLARLIIQELKDANVLFVKED